MKNLSNARVSQYRQKIAKLIAELNRLSLKAGHGDLIFHGLPQEVYRQCGKPNCRCAAGGEWRHGPYPVIDVWRNGKARQLSLKKSEVEYFEMAKHYQYQIQNRRKIAMVQEEILKEVDKMIEARTIWEKQ